MENPCTLSAWDSLLRTQGLTDKHAHTHTTTVLDLHIRNVGCSQGKTLASVFQRKGVASDFKFFKKPYFCSKDKKCLGSASQHLLRHSRTGCPKHVTNPGTSSGQKRQPLMSERRAVNQANTWTFKPELLPEVLGNWSSTVGIFCTIWVLSRVGIVVEIVFDFNFYIVVFILQFTSQLLKMLEEIECSYIKRALCAIKIWWTCLIQPWAGNNSWVAKRTRDKADYALHGSNWVVLDQNPLISPSMQRKQVKGVGGDA